MLMDWSTKLQLTVETHGASCSFRYEILWAIWTVSCTSVLSLVPTYCLQQDHLE